MARCLITSKLRAVKFVDLDRHSLHKLWIASYCALTSSRRGRDDRGRWLRLRLLLLAPEPRDVVLEVAEVPPVLRRRLTLDAAVDRGLVYAVLLVHGGGAGPRRRRRLADVRQGLPARELAFAGRAAPFPKDVGELSETGSPAALIRRRGLLGLVRWRDRRDLRGGVPSARPWKVSRVSCAVAFGMLLIENSLFDVVLFIRRCTRDRMLNVMGQTYCSVSSTGISRKRKLAKCIRVSNALIECPDASISSLANTSARRVQFHLRIIHARFLNPSLYIRTSRYHPRRREKKRGTRLIYTTAGAKVHVVAL